MSYMRFFTREWWLRAWEWSPRELEALYERYNEHFARVAAGLSEDVAAIMYQGPLHDSVLDRIELRGSSLLLSLLPAEFSDLPRCVHLQYDNPICMEWLRSDGTSGAGLFNELGDVGYNEIDRDNVTDMYIHSFLFSSFTELRIVAKSIQLLPGSL